MPSQTLEELEERLSELEAKVARLSGEEQAVKKPASWLDLHFGAFKDSPYYEAAMERGAEYRRSQPTAAEEWEEANANGETSLSSGH